MKNIFVILLCILIMGACKKDKDVVSKEVTVSYPQITLNGDKYVSLHIGESYTDPGASVFDDVNGSTSNVSADKSTLDINTPGLYYISYTAKNANGYISSAARYIAVTDYDDATDLSGVYQRTANGITVNLTKVARGMYMTDDMGGAGINDVGYFTVIDESTIDLGAQLSESLGTEIDGANESLTITSPDDIVYTYSLSAPGYGTAVRVFVKVGNL
jgi:hypothetical protein